MVLIPRRIFVRAGGGKGKTWLYKTWLASKTWIFQDFKISCFFKNILFFRKTLCFCNLGINPIRRSLIFFNDMIESATLGSERNCKSGFALLGPNREVLGHESSLQEGREHNSTS